LLLLFLQTSSLFKDYIKRFSSSPKKTSIERFFLTNLTPKMVPSIAQDATGAGSAVSPPLNPFHQLVADLSKILGPSSGLNSSDIDVRELQKLMENYISSRPEWDKYAFQDLSRGYTRNLVDEGNGKSNLVSS
jgi:hypothetical protein